jgi:preprotein translocase subunit SecE
MKRVTWPSRAQVESTTLVVILSVFAFAAYFRLVDFIINSTVVRGYTALTK